MDAEQIKLLMETMEQTGLNLLKLEQDNFKLHLEKAPAGPVLAMPASGPASDARPDTAKAGAHASETEPKPFHDTAAAEDKPGFIVTSPVVGIYYSAPSPDSDPFIQIGSPISKGDTICIIEAMKLMNEVTSDREGVILEIMVENGQRVEYGQPLIRIGGKNNVV